MAEQIQLDPSYLATPTILEKKPYLSNLFRAIDELIADCVEENDGNLIEIQRFVAGYVAREDLVEFEKSFTVLEKKTYPTSDWNAITGIVKKQKMSHLFDKDTIKSAQKMYDELKGENKTRADQVRLEVEERKKTVSKKKQEKENSDAIAIQNKEDSYRVLGYRKDMKKLRDNIAYMRTNYGSHIVVISANESRDKQLTYPAISFANSDLAISVLNAWDERLGCHLRMDLLFGIILPLSNDTSNTTLTGKDRAALATILRKATVDSIKLVDREASSRIEWKKLFDGTGKYQVNGWPVDDSYKLSYDSNGKVNLKAYQEEQLTELIESIRKGDITFTLK